MFEAWLLGMEEPAGGRSPRARRRHHPRVPAFEPFRKGFETMISGEGVEVVLDIDG
jgi:hypothetical protein